MKADLMLWLYDPENPIVLEVSTEDREAVWSLSRAFLSESH